MRQRGSSYTVHTRLRRNERLAIERLQQTDVRDRQEPLLQKGSKRIAKRWKKKKQLHRAHATTSKRTAGYRKVAQTDVRDCQEPLLQNGLKGTLSVPSTLRNGRNRNERDEKATPAELPPSVENAAEREETLKTQAGKQCWHHFSMAPQAVPTQRTHASRVQQSSTKNKAGTHMNMNKAT
jgi:hypothetical protein